MSAQCPSSPSPRERRRHEDLTRRREDVVAGAAAVFASMGFHDAQMGEIAAAAEVSRTTLYALFESKERLYQEVIAVSHAKICDAVEKRAEEIDDPGQKLLSLIDSLFHCYEENQDLLRIYARGTNGVPTKIRGAMGESALQLFQSFTDWVIEVARLAKRAGYLQDLDPETVGVSLVGTVTTTAARWVELTPNESLSRQAANVRAQFALLLGSRAESKGDS